MKKILVMMVLAAVSISVAYSDVSAIIAPVGDTLKDISGNTVSMANGFFMLIADTAGDGLDGYNFGGTAGLNLTDTFAEDDDVLFYTTGYVADDVAFGSFSQQTYSGITAGQDYYAVWSDGTGWAGTYHIGTDVNWDVPTSGGTVSPSFSGYGDANTQYAAVPEPASALLVALGGGMVYALRRRGRNYIS
jgi:hypothetical protein